MYSNISGQYVNEISRLFLETKHQEFDIPSSPISINNAKTSSYSPLINNSSSSQSQSQESSPESILGRRFNYTQFGASGLQEYENQRRVVIDGGIVDKPEITNEHARNACEDPDIGFEFPRTTFENSKESYDISKILNTELSLDIQYTKFQMGLETPKRMWDTEMGSETTKGIWNSQMGIETPNRNWNSLMDSQTPNRISNLETGSETTKGIWNSQMGVETPNRNWNSQMGSQTPNRISNLQTGSETTKGIWNSQMGVETPNKIWNSEMGAETPNGIWNSQIGSETPNVIWDSQIGSETPNVIWDTQIGSETPNRSWNSQIGSETPNGIWNSQIGSETPNVIWDTQIGSETPNRSWNSQIGSETPNGIWNSQIGSETPNVIWDSQIGSETPNRSWNSQIGSETPNRFWNSHMGVETPNRFRNSQIGFETPVRTLDTDMIKASNNPSTIFEMSKSGTNEQRKVYGNVNQVFDLPQRNSYAKPVFETKRTVSLCDSDDFVIWKPLDPLQTTRSSTPHQNYELFPNIVNANFRAKTPSPPSSSRRSQSQLSMDSRNLTQYLHASRHDQPLDQSSLLNCSFSPSTVFDCPPVYLNVIKPNYICTFCRKNGETPSVYTSHVVKMKDGKKTIVTCPILRSLVCTICHQSGDNAHTITYCPELRRRNNGQPLRSTTVSLKNTRVKSNGRKRY